MLIKLFLRVVIIVNYCCRCSEWSDKFHNRENETFVGHLMKEFKIARDFKVPSVDNLGTQAIAVRAHRLTLAR